MSEEKKWRRTKHPSGKVSTYVVGGRMPEKGELPRGLMEVPTRIEPPSQLQMARERKLQEVAKEYSMGEMVVKSIKDAYEGRRLALEGIKIGKLLQSLDEGHELERMSAKIQLRQHYPDIYKIYREEKRMMKQEILK